MQPVNRMYYNLGYWFLILYPLSIIAFYNSYIGIILQPMVPIIHIHFILMILWMGMLVAQPFLIKYKKLSVHRAIGKVSYLLVPLVLLSSFLMMRFSHYRDIATLKSQAQKGLNDFSDVRILELAAEYRALPFIWFAWFVVFYILAIINRRKPTIHARFMLATGLALLGPIIDRIIFNYAVFARGIRLETVAFILADLVLFYMLWRDYKSKKPIRTLRSALIIYIAGQLLYFTGADTYAWRQIVTILMKPEV